MGHRVDLNIMENLTPPGYDPGILQPIVSHYIDDATLVIHSELKGTKNYNTPPKKSASRILSPFVFETAITCR
jgi:hypothetical protein